jgi:hypothetical protein
MICLWQSTKAPMRILIYFDEFGGWQNGFPRSFESLFRLVDSISRDANRVPALSRGIPAGSLAEETAKDFIRWHMVSLKGRFKIKEFQVVRSAIQS